MYNMEFPVMRKKNIINAIKNEPKKKESYQFDFNA